jgi:hypothetical protein
VDDVATQMIGPDPFVMIESEGQRVYVFRAHVAYVEDEMPRRSVYEDRGVMSIEPE